MAGLSISSNNELTVRLATLNADRFKEILISGLGNPAKFHSDYFGTLGALTARAWNYLCATGERNTDSLVLDTSTWVSHNGVDLKLGVQEIPSSFATQAIFLDHEFRGDKSLFLRLSHEISHSIAARVSRSPNGEALSALFAHAQVLRSADPERGLSALGSHSFYRASGAKEQATEDVTELVNMRLLSRGYFETYLGFLSNPNLAAARDHFGLVSRTDNQVIGLRYAVESALKDLN